MKFICFAIYKRQNYSIFPKEKKTENYLLPLPVVCNGVNYTSNYMSDNKKVLLSMSGGIDSTVAAILLLREGYSVVGVTYRTWDSVSEGCFEREKGCCTINAILEAKRMAEKMGFPHHFLDIRKEFKDSVVRNFIDEYIAGRTPNPCVVCNAKIKWHTGKGAGLIFPTGAGAAFARYVTS